MRTLILLLGSTLPLFAAIEVKETAKLPANGSYYDAGSNALSFASPPAPGELMIFGFRTNSSSFFVTPPSGWTEITLPQTTSGTHFLRLFWKLATQSEPSSYTFSSTAAVRVIGFRIGGAAQQQPIHAAGGRKFLSTTSVIMSTVAQSDPTPLGLDAPNGSLLIGWKAVENTVLNTGFTNGLANVVHQASNQFFSTAWRIYTEAATNQNSTCSWTNAFGGSTALVVVRADSTPMLAREYVRLGTRVIAIEPGEVAAATLSPASVRLKKNEAQSFVATFSPVVWSISPNDPTSLYGTISSSGLYVAPPAISSELSVVVEARQTAGGAVLATAIVVLEPDALLVTPGSVTVEQPSATVDLSANMAVTWSRSPAVGTIEQLTPTTARYTAPAAIPANETITITATSTGNPAVSGSALVTLQAVPAACAVNPVSLSFGHAGSETTVALTSCPPGYGWTASNELVSWITFGPPPGSPGASGSGNGSLTVRAAPNPTINNRSGLIIVDGQGVSVSQAGAPVSTVALSPPGAILAHGASASFTAHINGSPYPGDVEWRIESGPGSIMLSGYEGVYTAPPTVDPNNAVAVIRATDLVGTGTATATITLIPYAPPGTPVVTPATGSGLSQTFTFSVENPAGVTVTAMNALISPSIGQFQNACSILVLPSTPMGHEIRVQENQGSAFSLPIYGGQSGVAENSQCRVLASGSTVTVSGNVTSVTLNVQFKPGFIGQMVTGASTMNSTNYVTQMASLGTWNLTGNVAALLPSGAFAAPDAGATVTGDVTISGWALDNVTQVENAITNIQVLVDNVPQPGAVTMGLSSSICTTYPERSGCPNVGWTYTWDSRLVANGTRTIKVVITDGDNPPKTTEITRTVSVNNPPGVPITVQPASTFARMLVNGGYNPPYAQFTAYRGATVLSPVLWSLNPPYSSGSISSTGVYTPAQAGYNPAGTQIQVTATNPSDSTDKGNGYAILMGVLGGGAELMDLNPGQQVQYMTSVGNVTFSLSPNLGTITYYGVYTHNAGGYTPGTIVTITATQVGNSNVRETAYVRLW